MKITRILDASGKTLRDYFLCVYHEAEGNPLLTIPAARNIIRARLHYGIGPIYYSLYSFSSIPEERWSTYDTNEGFWLAAQKGKTPVATKSIADDKALFYQHCIEYRLPTVPIIGMVGASRNPLNGIIPQLDDIESWNAAIKSAPERMFFKPIDGAHGNGVFTAKKIGEQFEFEGQLGSATDLYAHLTSKLEHECALIIQPQIQAHSRMLDISSPNGLPTLRLVTAMRGLFVILCGKRPFHRATAGANGAVGRCLSSAILR